MIEKPDISNAISDTSVLLNLSKASGQHGKISHYFLIVVTEKLANTINPEDIKPDDVRNIFFCLRWWLKVEPCLLAAHNEPDIFILLYILDVGILCKTRVPF